MEPNNRPKARPVETNVDERIKPQKRSSHDPIHEGTLQKFSVDVVDSDSEDILFILDMPSSVQKLHIINEANFPSIIFILHLMNSVIAFSTTLSRLATPPVTLTAN